MRTTLYMVAALLLTSCIEKDACIVTAKHIRGNTLVSNGSIMYGSNELHCFCLDSSVVVVNVSNQSWMRTSIGDTIVTNGIATNVKPSRSLIERAVLHSTYKLTRNH